MQPTIPAGTDLKETTDAVVEFALFALREEFLRWDKSVNMGVAEMVWNAGLYEPEPTAFGAPGDRVLDGMMRRLMRERTTRYKHQSCIVLELDVNSAIGELVFTFALTWDEGESFQPCEIAVDWPVTRHRIEAERN